MVQNYSAMSADDKADAAAEMYGTLSLEHKRAIVSAANAKGLKVNGIPVVVAGAQASFAQVVVKQPHKLAGFTAEYGWHVINQATRLGRELKN